MQANTFGINLRIPCQSESSIIFCPHTQFWTKNLNECFITYPASYVTLPANDAWLEPGVRLDVCSLQHGASLYTHTVLNDHIRADRHVWTYPTVVTNFCSGVLKQTKNILMMNQTTSIFVLYLLESTYNFPILFLKKQLKQNKLWTHQLKFNP